MRQGKARGRGYGSLRRRFAESGVCVCPECGYTIPHVPGNPCSFIRCPVCQIPLIRNGDLQKKDSNVSHSDSSSDANNPKAIEMNFPKVNPDSCIGCGNCVDLCPGDAISLVDGKAFIDVDKCANCHACESACPVDAIY